MKRIIVFLLFVLSIHRAYGVLINDIEYSLNTSAKTAVVLSKTEGYKGDITIPSKITYNNVDYNVTLKTPNCQTIHIEGFYDQYAHPINLSRDGFIGLESLLI